MKGPEQAVEILSRLSGIKYLIIRNRDFFRGQRGVGTIIWVFRWVKDYHELVWNNQKFVLFHYPVEEWADYYKGAIHLHGHQHNAPAYNFQQAEAGLRWYDVGVDANDFKPVSIESIVHFLMVVK